MADTDDLVLDEAEETRRPSAAVSSEDLAQLLNKERNRAATAERRAVQAERQRDEARGAVSTEVEGRYNAEVTAVDTAIAAMTAQADQLEAEWTAKQEAGDYASAAKAMRAMQMAQSKAANFEGRKEWLTANKDTILGQARQPQATRPAVHDVTQYSASTQQWIAAHPEFVTDDGYRGEVFGHHHAALRRGLKAETPEYYRYIEQQLESNAIEREPAEPAADPELETEAAPVRPAAPRQAAAMPVQRRGSVTAEPPSGTVRLTSDEREAADMVMPDVPVQDYERNGQKMPGRYKLYSMNKRRLSGEGRL